MNDTPNTNGAAPAEPKRPDFLLLPGDLAQAVVDYLSSRPFNEVFQLINGMISLKPVTRIEAEIIQSTRAHESAKAVRAAPAPVQKPLASAAKAKSRRSK